MAWSRCLWLRISWHTHLTPMVPQWRCELGLRLEHSSACHSRFSWFIACVVLLYLGLDEF
jgi:hypothetical protein